MGVQEHRFTFERGVDSGREWRIYDVGGARSQVRVSLTLILLMMFNYSSLVCFFRIGFDGDCAAE
jgi:hypothetical protein